LEAQTTRPNGKGGAAKCFPQLPLDGEDYEQFFHAGKATRREREEGCGHLALKVAPAIEAANGEARAINAPGAGTGRTATKGVRNNHPTVKPVSVMQWCIRLATQPGGLVLDPFMGSGTTGVAATREGMRFVGIEMSPEYMQICEARIGHAAKQPVSAGALGGATGLPNVKPYANKPAEPHRSTTRTQEVIVFVKTIESNVKKGVKAELGPRTLIIGPNGIGKSSIVNAIELAISGRASDVIGRADVARGIDLLALTPAGDDALWAKAVLSSGEAASWRCEKNAQTGGAREAVHEIPRDVKVTFPVREVRQALEGKAETARVWLLGRMGSTVTEATVRGLLPEELRAAYIEVTQPLFGTPVQTLLDARDSVSKTARSLGSEAKGAEKLADQMGAGLGVEPTEEDIAEAQQNVRDATVALASVGQRRPSPEALRAEAEAQVQVYRDWVSRVNELRGIVGDAPLPDEGVAKLRESLVRVMAFTAQQRPDSCLVCGVAGPNHDAILHRAQSLVATVQQDIQRTEAHAQLAEAERNSTEARARAQAAVEAFQTAEQGPQDAGGLTREEASLALQTAESVLRGLMAAQAAWAGVRAAKARARDATARQRLYGDLKDAINEAVGGLLERSRREFVARVQKLLPETDVFDLVLTEGEREVCKFGFVRDGMLHTAVSGAEWARLTLALAASVTSDGEREIALLTPEERAFDPVSLRAVMAGLSHASGQVILTSPVAPQGRTPKGWTVIDLTPADEPKARKTKDADPVAPTPEPTPPQPVTPAADSGYLGGEASAFEAQPAAWIDETPPKAKVDPVVALAFGLGGSPVVAVEAAPLPGLNAVLGIGAPVKEAPKPAPTPSIDDFFASFLVK
jgi:energy-coupling factor transporter ATP-binding protein EcfA2